MPIRDPRPAKQAVSRRSVLKSAAAVTVLSTGLPMINMGRYQAFAASPAKYSAKTMRAVERALVIDMLAPLKIDFRPELIDTPFDEETRSERRKTAAKPTEGQPQAGLTPW